MDFPNCSLIRWMRACLRLWQGRGTELEVRELQEKVHGECKVCVDINSFEQLVRMLEEAGLEA